MNEVEFTPGGMLDFSGYVKRITAAVAYKGTDDHEDVISVLRDLTNWVGRETLEAIEEHIQAVSPGDGSTQHRQGQLEALRSVQVWIGSQHVVSSYNQTREAASRPSSSVVSGETD